MGDEVARIGIVDGDLGLRLSGDIGGGVTGKRIDKINLAEVAKFVSADF